MDDKNHVGKKYVLVAPDGGWGYMICISVTIFLVTITVYNSCFGMLYNNVFIEMGMGSTLITFLSGINAFSHSVAGFLTGPVLKIFTMRQVAITSAIIYNIGLIGGAFFRSKIPFFIFQGVLQGIGNGVLFNLSHTMMTSYFVRKRLLAVSITQTIPAILSLVVPQAIKWSLQNYGPDSTILFFCGLAMHCIISAVLMQPASWHMKRVELPQTTEAETKLLDHNGTHDNDEVPTIKLTDVEQQSKDSNDKDLQLPDSDVKKKNQLVQFLLDIFDTQLMKTYLLSCASVGLALACFSDLTFLIILPQALYSMSWDENDVAWALSLLALGDLITRMVFILANNWLRKIGSHEIYVFGLVIAFITRLGVLWWDSNTIVMLVLFTIMGVSRCTMCLLIPVVVADAVKPEKFTGAMGIVMMLFGTFNLGLGPVIGAVRDLTNSYATAMYILTSCFGIVIVFWSIELLYKKNKHKRTTKVDSNVKT